MSILTVCARSFMLGACVNADRELRQAAQAGVDIIKILEPIPWTPRSLEAAIYLCDEIGDSQRASALNKKYREQRPLDHLDSESKHQRNDLTWHKRISLANMNRHDSHQ